VPKHVAGKKFATDIIETGEIFAGVDPAILDIPQEQKNGDAVPKRRWNEEMTLTEEYGGVDIQALRGRLRPCEGGYLKGSLIVDIADANESMMVWRSDAVEYLDISTDITNGRIKWAVKKTLKKFPPGD